MLGGAIAPGPRLSFEALSGKTASLPLIGAEPVGKMKTEGHYLNILYFLASGIDLSQYHTARDTAVGTWNKSYQLNALGLPVGNHRHGWTMGYQTYCR